MNDLVRVRFTLERDDHGWPPVESEGLWAEPLGRSLFRLDNTPWFARGVAAGDVIEGRRDLELVWWFRRVRRRSGRLTVRVVNRSSNALVGEPPDVLSELADLGVVGETMRTPVAMVALDLAPEAPLREIKARLDAGVAAGRWYYEEGSVSRAWRQLPPITEA